MKVIEIFFNTLNNINLKFVVAILGIIAIFSLIIYLLFIIVSSFQSRRAAVKVKLPEIDGYGTDSFSEPQFVEPKSFFVEIAEDEVVQPTSKPVDERTFMTILTLEARNYIPKQEVLVDMPKIDN